MRKLFRLLNSFGSAALLLSLTTQGFAQDAATESAPRIEVTYENGRIIVTNASRATALMAPMPVPQAAPPEQLLDRSMPMPIQTLVHSISKTHGVDPRLVAAVMKVESNYNRWARSSKGALGLMQLIPATGTRFGVQDFFDPAQNIEGGVRYLKFLTEKFGSSRLDLLLAAYNAGENLVERLGQVPPIRETRDYVRKIQSIYRPPEKPVLTSALPESKPVMEIVEPEAKPAAAIYKTVDARGVVHFSNIGPPN